MDGEMGKLRLLVPALGVPHCPASLRRAEGGPLLPAPAPTPCAFGSAGLTLCLVLPFLLGVLPVRTGQVGGLWPGGETSLEEEGE